MHSLSARPVQVTVKRRERRVDVTDESRAVAPAGTPPGRREVARGIGVAPVAGRFTVEEIEERIAAASLALFRDLLDLAAD